MPRTKRSATSSEGAEPRRRSSRLAAKDQESPSKEEISPSPKKRVRASPSKPIEKKEDTNRSTENNDVDNVEMKNDSSQEVDINDAPMETEIANGETEKNKSTNSDSMVVTNEIRPSSEADLKADKPSTEASNVAPESTVKSTVKTNEKPVTELAGKPVTESTDKPSIESTDKPVIESADKPATELNQKPIIDSASKPLTESNDKPEIDSAAKPATESTEKSTPELTGASNIIEAEKADTKVTPGANYLIGKSSDSEPTILAPAAEKTASNDANIERPIDMSDMSKPAESKSEEKQKQNGNHEVGDTHDFEVVSEAEVPAPDSKEVTEAIAAQGSDGQLLVNFVQVAKADVPAAESAEVAKAAEMAKVINGSNNGTTTNGDSEKMSS